MRCCSRGIATGTPQAHKTVGLSALQYPLQIGFSDPEVALSADVLERLEEIEQLRKLKQLEQLEKIEQLVHSSSSSN